MNSLSIVDICRKESNLKVERFVNIVLLNRDKNFLSIVSCSVIHFVANDMLLIHSCLFQN